MDKMKVGVIGCGNISSIYFETMKKLEVLDVAACADLVMDKAGEQGNKYQVPKILTPKELFADKNIDIVVNLTVPLAHTEIALQAINSGKHVYSEKPFAISTKDGKKVIDAAKKKGLRISNAPDTFLGTGTQTCRKVIDDGVIGKPVSGTAFMTCHGHESWHPNPEFYYQVGGGPMFDMGPYYITALINLLGPITKITGLTKITFPERLITSQPKNGTKIKVETPTHLTGAMEFKNGAIVTIIMSFDIWATHLPLIEIHGTEGSLGVPDPNGFGEGTSPQMFKPCYNGWKAVPYEHSYANNSRGLGVADMASAIIKNRPHRTNGEMAYHVVEIMESFDISSRTGKHIKLKSTCERPLPMPLGLKEGQID